MTLPSSGLGRNLGIAVLGAITERRLGITRPVIRASTVVGSARGSLSFREGLYARAESGNDDSCHGYCVQLHLGHCGFVLVPQGGQVAVLDRITIWALEGFKRFPGGKGGEGSGVTHLANSLKA